LIGTRDQKDNYFVDETTNTSFHSIAGSQPSIRLVLFPVTKVIRFVGERSSLQYSWQTPKAAKQNFKEATISQCIISVHLSGILIP